MANNEDELGITVGENDGDSEQDEPLPDEEDTDTSASASNSKKFVSRIFSEDNGQVYGTEIVLLDSENSVIDKIWVTDSTEFEGWFELLSNMKNAYVPYTNSDVESLDKLKEYKSRLENNEITQETYENLKGQLAWSDSSKESLSLADILYNKSEESTVDGESIYIAPYDINATSLQGTDKTYTVSELALKNHAHDYASIYHATQETKHGLGDETQYGHVKVINNLTSENHLSGHSLSAYQGRVLKDDVTRLDNKFSWSNKWLTVDGNDYLKYKVNTDLKLIVCTYNRSKYTGISKSTGKTVLHDASKGIPKEYRPFARVTAPLYRGDITLSFNNDGTITLYNLVAKNEINIHTQVMWYYKPQ